MRRILMIVVILGLCGCRTPRRSTFAHDTAAVINQISYNNDDTTTWDGYSIARAEDQHSCSDAIVDTIVDTIVDKIIDTTLDGVLGTDETLQEELASKEELARKRREQEQQEKWNRYLSKHPELKLRFNPSVRELQIQRDWEEVLTDTEK